MTVIGAWTRLTLPGKIIFTVVPVLLALTVGAGRGRSSCSGRWSSTSSPTTCRSSGSWSRPRSILLMTIPTAFLIIYMEMKVIALMNLRIGPDRVGPFGSLLSVVHGLKVLMKEDFTPTGADPIVFTWAPVVVYLAQRHDACWSSRSRPGCSAQDLNIGLLYFFAIGGLSRRRPADGRLVELQQVLAARRPARRRPRSSATRSR